MRNRIKAAARQLGIKPTESDEDGYLAIVWPIGGGRYVRVIEECGADDVYRSEAWAEGDDPLPKDKAVLARTYHNFLLGNGTE